MNNHTIEILALGFLLVVVGERLSAAQPLTPSEWTLNFTRTYCTLAQQRAISQQSDPFNNAQRVCRLDQKANVRDDLEQNCKREPTAWRWLYADELDPPFRRLINEKSLKERLANIVYVSTIAKVFKNDINHYKFNAESAKQNAINQQLVSGKRVNDSLCLEHLHHMIDTMKDLEFRLKSQRHHYESTLADKHVYLARVLDSFGRYSSGHLSGRFHVFGAYDQCIKSQLLLDGGQKVSTRYCMANLQLNDYLSKELRERKRYPHETGDALLHVGFCIPETCHSKSFNQSEAKLLVKRLIDSQFQLPRTIYKSKNLELDSVFCLVDDDSQYNQISTEALVFVGAIVIWSMAICYHSLGSASKQTPDHPLNVVNSFQKLFHEESTEEAEVRVVDLEALESSKAIAQMTIIMLHAGSFMGGFTDDSMSCAIFSERDPFLSGLIMFTSMVDTFFALNGLIHTYKILKQLATRVEPSHNVTCFVKLWFMFALERYLRLVPMLFLVFAFKKALFVHISNGPMWDKGLNQDTGMGYCLQRQSWLSPFDLSNLKIQIPYNCVTVSWSIVNEIIFALILPPIVLLIHHRPKLGSRLVIALTVIVSSCCFKAFNEVDARAVYELRELRSYAAGSFSTIFFHLYSNPFYRLPSFLVGILGGWYLFHNENHPYKADSNDKNPSIVWPWWFDKLAARFALLTHLTGLVFNCKISILRKSLSPYHQLIPSHLFSTMRVVVSSAYIILFLRISTDWRRTNWIVKHVALGKFWKFLGKLNYLLLLVHWDVMTYDFGIRTQEVFCSRWMVWSLFASTYLTSLALSVPLYLLVQNPLNSLIRRFVLENI